MVKENGHFLAALDFFNNYESAKYKIPNPLASSNGITNSGNAIASYSKEGITVNGLLKTAVLVVDWWTLFGEPTENYIFKWTANSSYRITYKNTKGTTVNANVSETNLAKYPDLLKRFKAIAPDNIQFEIKWTLGEPAEAELKKLNETYQFKWEMNAHSPYQNKEWTTLIKDGLLFEPAGLTPLSVPSIRPGKGQGFLGLPANYELPKLKPIFAYFNASSGMYIKKFRVVSMSWPVGEMKSIAEKYIAYEAGEEEPTPKNQVAKANEQNKNIPPYTKNDFWGDAVEEDKVKIDFVSNNNEKLNTGNINLKIGNKIIPGVLQKNLLGRNANNQFMKEFDVENGNQATVIQKEKKVLAIFYVDNQAKIPEFRVLDYKGNHLFKDKYNGEMASYYTYHITYLCYPNTPFVLVAKWSYYGLLYHYTNREVYLLNLKTFDKMVLDLPAGSDRSTGNGLVFFDFSKKSDQYAFTFGGNRNNIEKYYPIYQTMSSNYASTHQYLILLGSYAHQSTNLIYQVYGISKENQVQNLGKQ